MDFLQTLLVAAIPSIISGVLTFFVTRNTSKKEISALQEKNAHDLTVLMEQHKIDIESLERKHVLDMETRDKDHQHKIDIMQKEHELHMLQAEKQAANSAMYGAMGELMKNPAQLDKLLRLAPSLPQKQ